MNEEDRGQHSQEQPAAPDWRRSFGVGNSGGMGRGCAHTQVTLEKVREMGPHRTTPALMFKVRISKVSQSKNTTTIPEQRTTSSFRLFTLLATLAMI